MKIPKNKLALRIITLLTGLVGVLNLFEAVTPGLPARIEILQEIYPCLEGGLDYLYQHLNRFYNFQGLHGFKEKFNPRWKPHYLIYPNLATLPDVVVALVRADSGGLAPRGTAWSGEAWRCAIAFGIILDQGHN